MSTAVFMRKIRRFTSYFLSIVLAISTLSAISAISTPTANALINSDCTPTVSGLTATGVASGANCVVTITAGSGTWTKPNGVTSVRYLLVGGGGAGGSTLYGSAGGGGGGQVKDATLTTISNTSIAVVIGAGGSPTDVATVASGGDGGATSITPNGGTLLTALGGGGGANSRLWSASPQGSGSTTGWTGGGGSSHATTTVTGSTGTGGASLKGGNAFGSGTSDLQAAGGGGGAGGAGVAATSGVAGAGGVGLASNISGASTFYGGGGGGAKRTDATGIFASGGNGGGGKGGIGATNSTSGTANTGGGGGGASEYAVSKSGGSGGSGVVVFLYARPSITSLNVTSGVTSGGTAVTITGLSLATTTGVTVGGVAATNVVAISDTSVSFTTPAGTAGVADVAVISSYGTVTNAGAFTYYTTMTPACSGGGTFTIVNNVVTTSASCIGPVTVPEGVTEIGVGAFCNNSNSCVNKSDNVRSVTLPASLVTINTFAFMTSGLTSITFGSPSKLKTIGIKAFSYTGLTTITIPTSVNSLGGAPFYNSSSLTSVVFEEPGSLTSLGANPGGNGEGMFQGTAIKSLTLPSSVTYVGYKLEAPLTQITVNGNIANATNALLGLPTSPFSPPLSCVINPNNYANINNYTYWAPQPVVVSSAANCPATPTITSLSPTTGDNAGGTSVTLTGTGLTGVNKVWVNGVLATNLSVVSATSLTFKTPASALVGSCAVWVSGTNGPAIKASAFTYTSSVATLSALALSNSAVLSPTFDSATTSYTTTVGNSVSSLTVTPTKTQANASIKVNGVAVNSGAASAAIPLSVGSNTITVLVTAQNGTTTKSYTITVTREAGISTYAITLAAGTGGSGGNQTLTKTNGVNLTLPDSVTANSYFTRAGYTVTGWATTDLGTQAYATGGTFTTEAATTLYPVWTAKTLTVTYDATGGSTVTAGSTVTGGSISAAPIAPTKGGYSFAGWSATDGGSAITFPFTHGKTANFTLYALWAGNTYVVTYDYNSATSDSSTATSSYVTGGTTITLPTPLRTGYSFDGWYSDALLTTSIGAGGASYSPTGSSLTPSAYAKWTAVNRTVTYSAASATGGAVPTDATNYIIGNTVVIKGNTGSLVRSGYTFLGWTYASDGTGTLLTSGMTYTTSTSDMIFYAKWSANTYTITYNGNNASGNAQRSSANVTSDSYTSGGSAIALPGAGTLSRSGYTFGGWNTTAAGTGDNYLEAASFTTAINVTLYAKWTPVVYSITYDGNTSDGGSAPTTGAYTTGQALPYTVLTNTFSKTSNIFGGWNTAANGTGTNYSSGTTFTTLTNVVLYALWIPQYTLHYAINGGTVTSGSLPTDQLYTANAVVGPVFSLVVRTGYTFAGWTNGATTIAPNGNFTIVDDSVLTAKWTPVDYTISYDPNGGSTTPDRTTKQIGQSYTVANAISKSGYTFTGWLSGATKVGAGAVIIMDSSNVTYVAQWSANVYTISYDWNGGSGSRTNSDTFTVGSSAVTLPSVGDHLKDGYTFGGWATSINGTQVNDSYSPPSDVTLYARWGTGSFVITYDANGGTVGTSSTSILSGSTITLPSPTRTNFIFEGWFTAASGGTLIGAAASTYQPTQSRTIYAHWIQESLYGIAESSLTRIGTATASTSSSSTFSYSNALSAVSVTVPAGSLPNGTIVNFDLVGDFSRAQSVLASSKTYIISVVVSWLTTTGTVPDTASDKPILMTVTNDSIKTGASVYSIISGVSTLLGTATQDGTVTFGIASDPEIVIVSSKPSAPTGVAASSNGAGASVVSWTAPSDGGSAISGYTVNSSGGQSCTTASTSCTVSSLLNGTSYTFTVVATNSNGDSPASASATARTAGKPSAPTSVTASEGAVRESVISWSAPEADGGSTITGYTATANGGASCTTTLLSCTITGLSDGVTYAITVTATNALGTSDASAAATAITASKPSAPTSVTATSDGNKESVITWAAPAFDGGSAITGYTATASNGAACTTSNTSCTVTGLSDGTTYTFTVTATSALGTSDASVSASAKTADGVGGAGGTQTPQVTQSVTSQGSVANNVITVAPVTVVGDAQTNIPTIEIAAAASGSNSNLVFVKVDAASKKFVANLKIVEGKLVLTSEAGFSGKKTVTVTITENGIDRIIKIPLTVLPEAVSKPVVTPTSSSKTVIRWTPSPNASTYNVFVDGKQVARAILGTSFSINKILGPNSIVEIVANGGDRTTSSKISANFNGAVSIQITSLVSTSKLQTSLTSAEKKALDKVISLIRTQGFKTVVISSITTTKTTNAAATARIASIKKYIDSKSAPQMISYEVTTPTSRTFVNNIFVKG
ncbi:Listeria/Bacterioides repeat [Candidatus Nanopelagicaceae bacterium]